MTSRFFGKISYPVLLICLLPFAIILPPIFIQAIFFTLASIGLFNLLVKKQEVSIFTMFIGLVFFTYFASLFFQAFRVNQIARLFYFGSGEYFFLGAALICFAFRDIDKSDLNWFIDSCKIAISLLFVFLLIRFINQNFSGRIHWHAQLGAIVLSLSWCAINIESKFKFGITLFVSLIGVIAVALSGTRSALILLSLLNTFLLIFYLINKKSILRIFILFVFIHLTILVNILLLDTLNSRVLSAVSVLDHKEIGAYVDSTKIRLDIYKLAFKVGAEKLYTGYGYDDPIITLKLRMNDALLLASQGHTYLHNSYLDSYMVGGIIQFFILLGLFYSCFYYFFYLRFGCDDFMIKSMALVLLTAYIIFGSFESVLVGAYECGFLVLTLCFLSSKKVVR